LSASAAAAGSGVSAAAAAAGSSVAATTTERKRSATRRRASVLSSERTAIVVVVAVSSGAERGRWRCERQQSKRERAREQHLLAKQAPRQLFPPRSSSSSLALASLQPIQSRVGSISPCGSLPLVPYEPRTTTNPRVWQASGGMKERAAFGVRSLLGRRSGKLCGVTAPARAV